MHCTALCRAIDSTALATQKREGEALHLTRYDVMRCRLMRLTQSRLSSCIKSALSFIVPHAFEIAAQPPCACAAATGRPSQDLAVALLLASKEVYRTACAG